MTNPKTTAEWQEAVDVAYVMLLVDSAKQFGLITGPDVNISRCNMLIEQGAALGITPSPNALNYMLR
jgi:hypothetical protein